MGSHRVLLTAGSNAKGQLGIGSNDDAHSFTPCQFAEFEPSQLPDDTTVCQIACGANHTVLLLKHPDGAVTLWGTGDGRKGQLGPGYGRGGACSTIFRELLVPFLKTYTARGYMYTHVAAAWETTYVVFSRPESSDVLLSMGSNDFGALGVGGEADGDRETPAQIVSFDHIISDKALPSTICVRSLHVGPRHVVVQLAITDGHGMSSTTLVGWGACRHGQLGQNGGVKVVARPTPLPIDIYEDPMVSCGIGNQHTVVLHASGRISALGSNKQGQIPKSIGSQKRVCKLGCTWNGTYMHAMDGDRHVLLSMGNNAQGQLGRRAAMGTSETVDLAGNSAISGFVCGSEHVLVAMDDSSRQGSLVVGWGWNEHGNMGVGDLANISVPTQLWPNENDGKYPQKVMGIWAGCATSWLVVE